MRLDPMDKVRRWGCETSGGALPCRAPEPPPACCPTVVPVPALGNEVPLSVRAAPSRLPYGSPGPKLWSAAAASWAHRTAVRCI